MSAGLVKADFYKRATQRPDASWFKGKQPKLRQGTALGFWDVPADLSVTVPPQKTAAEAIGPSSSAAQHRWARARAVYGINGCILTENGGMLCVQRPEGMSRERFDAVNRHAWAL